MEYKSVQKYYKRKNKSKQEKEFYQENKMKRFFIGLSSRVLIAAILFLIALIGCKNPSIKGFINEQVYHTNIAFAEIRKWFSENVGDILPFQNVIPKEKPVFSEKLIYQEANIYQDGVSLQVGENYLVPTLESGIVVFMGEKEGYGKTVVVQQVNGVDVWYSNITVSTDIKLYDYIEKGSMIGESMGERIYLVFQKEGKFLNYQDYLE